MNNMPPLITLVFVAVVDLIVTIASFVGDLNLGQGIIAFILSTLLAYLVAEWTFFFKYKDKLMHDSAIGSLLNDFSEANVLIDKIVFNVKKDLSFKNQIYKSRTGFELHSYLSNMKYNKFVNSHFVFCAENKHIKKIPGFFFEQEIWRKLINNSDCYLSMQLLTNDELQIYLKDRSRLDAETNHLKSQLSQPPNHAQLECFHKLFVIKDDLVDAVNKQIKCNELSDYLRHWENKFKDNNKACLKLMTYSEARGRLEHISDIGIFGNILGIQSVINNADEFIADELIFEFSLDSEYVNMYRRDYEVAFSVGKNLSEFVTSCESQQ